MAKLLEVKGLETKFFTQDGVVNAVNGISFDLDEGETLGVVGESGCGKSVTMLSIMRLVPSPPGRIVAGEVLFAGQDLMKLSGEEMRRVRGKRIAMVFQDPMTSFNPVLTVGRQVEEALEVHLGMSREAARKQTVALLELVGIPDAPQRVDDYPHQFSGGMRQRAMIAMALSCNPELLIADEPTTALDVTIQAQILDLVKHLKEQIGLTVIWITHDLGVIAGLAERVIVMYAGYVVEEAPVRDIFRDPRHPYTLGLLHCLPRLDAEPGARLSPIEGLPPDLIGMPRGCPFLPRCPYHVDLCREENPPLELKTTRHEAACWVDVAQVRGKGQW